MGFISYRFYFLFRALDIITVALKCAVKHDEAVIILFLPVLQSLSSIKGTYKKVIKTGESNVALLLQYGVS